MGLLIVDGERKFGRSLERFISEVTVPAARGYGVKLRPVGDVAVDSPPAYARVEHGRWIADCPDCPGAVYVWLREPLMFCGSCFNAAIDTRWRRVIIPANAGEIAEILERRTMPANRNWQPNESLEQLRADNILHGVR